MEVLTDWSGCGRSLFRTEICKVTWRRPLFGQVLRLLSERQIGMESADQCVSLPTSQNVALLTVVSVIWQSETGLRKLITQVVFPGPMNF